MRLLTSYSALCFSVRSASGCIYTRSHSSYWRVMDCFRSTRSLSPLILAQVCCSKRLCVVSAGSLVVLISRVMAELTNWQKMAEMKLRPVLKFLIQTWSLRIRAEDASFIKSKCMATKMVHSSGKQIAWPLSFILLKPQFFSPRCSLEQGD